MEKNSKNSKFLSLTTKKFKFFRFLGIIFSWRDTEIRTFDHKLAKFNPTTVYLLERNRTASRPTLKSKSSMLNEEMKPCRACQIW